MPQKSTVSSEKDFERLMMPIQSRANQIPTDLSAETEPAELGAKGAFSLLPPRIRVRTSEDVVAF